MPEPQDPRVVIESPPGTEGGPLHYVMPESAPGSYPEGAQTVETWINRLADAEGPATRERKRVHLRAMVMGASQHPGLRWCSGEMLTEDQFRAGVAMVEGKAL